MACPPSHGENRGSSPLGSANDFNSLIYSPLFVSNRCPIYVRVHGQILAYCASTIAAEIQPEDLISQRGEVGVYPHLRGVVGA